MAENRRNYYRILNVQPDAPHAVIKASYRALMSTLRQHPDLGGDHATAALINEAWHVLGDEGRRQAYDRAHPVGRMRGRGAAAPDAAAGAPPPRGGSTAAGPAPGTGRAAGAAGPGARSGGSAAQPGGRSGAGTSDAAADGRRSGCPMCAAPLPAIVEAGVRCSTCRSPLGPLDGREGPAEWFGRRRATRAKKSLPAKLRVAGSTVTTTVVVADLSMTGIGLIARQALRPGSVVRVTSDEFDVLAEIVGARRVPRGFGLNARLLSGLFERRRGLFVDISA